MSENLNFFFFFFATNLNLSFEFRKKKYFILTNRAKKKKKKSWSKYFFVKYSKSYLKILTIKPSDPYTRNDTVVVPTRCVGGVHDSVMYMYKNRLSVSVRRKLFGFSCSFVHATPPFSYVIKLMIFFFSRNMCVNNCGKLFENFKVIVRR